MTAYAAWRRHNIPPANCKLRAMGNGMNKIIPGLYLGSARDSNDKEQLETSGITHILSIMDIPKRASNQCIKYLFIDAVDCEDQNISQYFSQCNDFIHEARMNGGAVLVHCMAGISRSATIVVAYLMAATSLDKKHALRCVRVMRSIACPNSGFQKQLRDFEGRPLREERKRLSLKFAEDKRIRQEDEERVKKVLEFAVEDSKSEEEPDTQVISQFYSKEAKDDIVTSGASLADMSLQTSLSLSSSLPASAAGDKDHTPPSKHVP